jgi:phosphoglycolate phosphatase-like HAD superfamily hydrolase
MISSVIFDLDGTLTKTPSPWQHVHERLGPDGTPLGIPSSDDPRGTYELTPPAVLADANILDRFVQDGAPVAVDDDLARYLGAYLAHTEEEDDVAAVIEPLSGGRMRVEFRVPQRAVAPGQSAVIYIGDELLGGGRIIEALR